MKRIKKRPFSPKGLETACAALSLALKKERLDFHLELFPHHFPINEATPPKPGGTGWPDGCVT